MEHNHPHHHGHIHGHHHGGSSNIATAFWLNLAFTIIEVAGGLYTNSIAILSDAVHDLGDSVSLLFSLLMERVSLKKSDKVLTYGYKRYSLLGAFFSSLILLIGSTFIIYGAVSRLFEVEEVNTPGMAGIALVGILFNGLAVLRLRKDDSLNAKVVFMHLLEDVLGWMSILIISIAMLFLDLPILDPILSIVIAVFVLSRIIPTFMKIGRIFLQYRPDDMEVENIKKAIEKRPEILEIHDIHLWSLDGVHHIFSCHIVFNADLNAEKIIAMNREIKEQLKGMDVHHSTLESEFDSAECDPCDKSKTLEGVSPRHTVGCTKITDT